MRQTRVSARHALMLVAIIPFVLAAQEGTLLFRRWVGTHDGRPLVLDFYGDTMLVIDDDRPVEFRYTADSLMVRGDTSFAVSYWFVRDRMMIQSTSGDVITLAQQDILARPLDGNWRGAGSDGLPSIELVMGRGGVARWRTLPTGRWISGEWDRRTRTITFTWFPDSVTWTAQYDPPAGALQLVEPLTDAGGAAILHRAYRW